MKYRVHRFGVSMFLTGLMVAACGGGNDNTGSDSGETRTRISSAQEGLTIPKCVPPQVVTCTPLPGGPKYGPCFCLTPSPPPVVEQGTVTPQFFITHVVYAPAGKSSSISYANSTTVGTTTSATSGFKTDTKITADASGGVLSGASVSISADHSFGTTSTDALDVSVQTTQGYKKNGEMDGVNHDNDEIWFLIRPLIDVTFSSSASSVSWQFAPNQDGVNNGIEYQVYVGWLSGAVPMPVDVKAVLDYYGITPSEYGTLLAADPLANGMSPNQGMDPTRFDFIGEFPYEPPLGQGDTPGAQMYSLSQNATSSTTNASDESYSVGLTLSASFGGGLFSTKLSVANTWTWTSSSSLKESTGSGSADSLTVGQPAFGYTGPTLLHVYEDRIYKTYAFTLDYLPTCSGSCGGQAPAGCWCDALCERYGDCCTDSAQQCGSCRDSCNGQSPAGCWCDSLCAGHQDCCSDSLAVCGL